MRRGGHAARRAWTVARFSLWLAPDPSRALRVRNNRIDALCQRLLGRALSSLVSGLPMLLLTTRGRKTGQPRTVALAYAVLDGGYLVVGGDHGAARDPQWVRNVAAHGEVSIELGRHRLAADARVLDVAEAETLWPRVAVLLPPIELYRQRAPRAIPLVRIVPRAARDAAQ